MYRNHREAIEEGCDDFDLDEELAALDRSGFVFPLPIVERCMDVWAVVKAVGWPGAVRLCDATFTGWEVGFLGYALSLLAAWDHGEETADQQRLLLQVLGAKG